MIVRKKRKCNELKIIIYNMLNFKVLYYFFEVKHIECLSKCQFKYLKKINSLSLEYPWFKLYNMIIIL